jgi:3D (Asp-Asp-Asp) domain-containing protein
MFELVGAIINGVKKVKKITKKMQLSGRTVSSAQKFIEQAKGLIIGYVKGFMIMIIIVALILGGIVESIKSVFDFYISKGGNGYDPVAISQQISDEDANMLVETGGINPKKLQVYAQIEATSYPKSAKVKMHTIDDGKDITSDYNLDLTSLSAKFKIPWQFTAGLDILNDSANDKNNKKMTDATKAGMTANFTWGYDKYTKDETDSRKEWVVETTDGAVVKNTESQARQIDVTKKWPLPFADEVTTPYKKYLYEYKLDKVTRDDPWSQPIVMNRKEWDTTVLVSKGNKTTPPTYKTVHHVITSYKRVKKKTVEDVLSNTNEYTDPQRLISFFDSNNINLDDLGIIYDMLEDMPNTGGLREDMKDIIDGDYSNSGVGGISGGVLIDGSSFSAEMPLFIQWDKRWGDLSYGNSGTIKTSGCGPTSMAMIITGLRGNVTGIDRNNDGIVDPSETSAYSVSNGFRVEGQGTSWDFFGNIGAKAGLKVTQVSPSNYQKVLDHLLKGNPVIASMGPSTFTKNGHFIVLTGVDVNGKITVKDPNSEIKSKQSWDFISTIVAEGKQFWLVENPDLFNSEGIFQVTAYGGVHNLMEGGGVTADGTTLDDKDFRNRIIAVDRTQIKLGTKVYMQFPENKRYMYKAGVKYDLNGWYTARDVGGAIKTNKIDLFVGFGGASDTKIAEDFGRVDGIKVRWRK